jgi:hypothetical protein
MIQRECLVFWVRSRPHRGYSSDRLWEEGVSRGGMDKRSLSERDICTKFITPALRQAGWDEMLQIREEVGFTKDRIIVRGKLVTRGQAKRADYVLYYKPNILRKL